MQIPSPFESIKTLPETLLLLNAVLLQAPLQVGEVKGPPGVRVQTFEALQAYLCPVATQVPSIRLLHEEPAQQGDPKIPQSPPGAVQLVGGATAQAPLQVDEVYGPFNVTTH